LEYLLFAAYLILFAWLVTRVKFFKRSGLNDSQLIIIFLLKVMAGIFYGWIGLYYGNLAQMSDTWFYHYSGIQEYQLLGSHPHEYFMNLLRNPYEEGFSRFFSSSDSYWNDLKGNFFIKVLSVFDIFSFGNYYINVIFFSFVTMFGPVAVYRVMMDVFPGKKIQVLIATFLIPSFIYWTSGLHKEGLIFTGLGIVIFNFYFGLKNNSFSIQRILMIIFGLLLILILRNFLIIILIPAIIAWVLASKFPKYGLTIFASLYLLFSILFFTTRYINPKFDFPQAVVNKQEDFLKLQGGSVVPIRKLEPTAISFLINAPQALNLSIIRPYPSDVKHLLSLAAAAEINFLLFLFAIFLIWRTNGVRSRIFIYFCLFFSLSHLLSIGYTVNFLGAIVRYRSIVFPFLFVPVFCEINWKRIYDLIFNNIKNKNNIEKNDSVSQ
jgi:hypothetical protein